MHAKRHDFSKSSFKLSPFKHQVHGSLLFVQSVLNDSHQFTIRVSRMNGIHNFIRTKCHTDQSEVLETLIRNTLLSLYDQKAHALLVLRRVTLPAYEKREHIFPKPQVTSNKNAHNFRHHFQAQFLMLFHLPWSILFGVLAWETAFSLVEILQ